MKSLEDLLLATERQVRWIIIETLDTHKVPYELEKWCIVTTSHDIKPLVCVHTDTVDPFPPVEVVTVDGIVSLPKNSSAKCLGADDRAGVWIALELIKQGYTDKFNFGFFSGEEIGCTGSRAFSKEADLKKYSCFIGLDRACRNGKQNAATYGYDNEDLYSLSTYELSYGSYTDCSVLAEAADLACINFSVGYQHEHTKLEVLSIDQMVETLEMMKSLPLLDQPLEAESHYKLGTVGGMAVPICCDYCEEHALLYDRDGEFVCEMCLELYCNTRSEVTYGR